MPRLKPPFPAQSGYWKKPSNINNVETFANVSWIINNGGEAFAAMGTEGSKGTKVFAVTGKVKRSGLVEIPMGKTLRDVIFDIGGGMKGDKAFKAVQMGGPSGGCIPAELIDTVIDYKALGATGAIMGSGGMVVMDEGTCIPHNRKRGPPKRMSPSRSKNQPNTALQRPQGHNPVALTFRAQTTT